MSKSNYFQYEFKQNYEPQKNNNDNIDSKKVLQELNNTLNKSELNLIINSSQDKKVIAVIGKTGAGKSTFINKVIGNKIEYNKSQNILSDECVITVKGMGPKIGGGIVSETTIPTVWQYSKNSPNILIGDTAGLFDNRGELQDIINAFCLRKLLVKSSEIKFVIVVEQKCLFSSRITEFKTLINSLEKSLPNINKLTNSFSLIVTKLPSRAKISMISYKLNEIKSKLLKNSIIIDALIKNKSVIGLFYNPIEQNKPQAIKSLTSPIEKSIFVDSELIFDMKPTLSPNSIKYLAEQKLILSNMKEFDDFLKIFDDVKKDFKIDNNLNKSQLRQLQLKYHKHKELISKMLSNTPKSWDSLSETIIHTVKKLTNKLITLPPSLKMKIDFLEFIDKALNQETDYTGYWSKFQLKVNDIFRKIVHLEQTAETKLNDIIKQENIAQQAAIMKEQQAKLAEIQRKIDETNKQIQNIPAAPPPPQIVFHTSCKNDGCTIMKQETIYDNPLLEYLSYNQDIFNKIKNKTFLFSNLVETFKTFNSIEIKEILHSENTSEKLFLLMGMYDEYNENTTTDIL